MILNTTHKICASSIVHKRGKCLAILGVVIWGIWNGPALSRNNCIAPVNRQKTWQKHDIGLSMFLLFVCRFVFRLHFLRTKPRRRFTALKPATKPRGISMPYVCLFSLDVHEVIRRFDAITLLVTCFPTILQGRAPSPGGGRPIFATRPNWINPPRIDIHIYIYIQYI